MTAPCDARCCDQAEVPLLEADVTRLEKATGRGREDFVDAVAGWWVLRGTGLEGCVFRGRVVVAGRSLLGCTVHPDRPSACRTYPFVLGAEGRTLRRDDGCPFAAGFAPPPEGTAERLFALERQLDVERAARRTVEP